MHLTDKIDCVAICPHCGDEYCHTFYTNATTLTCENAECEKEFDIEIHVTDIKIVSSK